MRFANLAATWLNSIGCPSRRRKRRRAPLVSPETLERRIVPVTAPIVVQYSTTLYSFSEYYDDKWSGAEVQGAEYIVSGSHTSTLVISESGPGWAVSGSAATTITVNGGTVGIQIDLNLSYSGPNGPGVFTHFASNLNASADVSVWVAGPNATSFEVAGQFTQSASGSMAGPSESRMSVGDEVVQLDGNGSAALPQRTALSQQRWFDPEIVHEEIEYSQALAGFSGWVSAEVPYLEGDATESWSGSGTARFSGQMTFAPQLPDLEVDSFKWKLDKVNKQRVQSGGPIPRGTELQISTTVRNDGTNWANGNPQVIFRYDDTQEEVLLGTLGGFSLPPRSSQKLAGTITIPENRRVGAGQLFVAVDWQNLLVELDETNNRSSTQSMRLSALPTGIYVGARDLDFGDFPVPGKHQFVVLIPQSVSRKQGTIDLGDGTRAIVLGAYREPGTTVEWILNARMHQGVDTEAIQQFVNPGALPPGAINWNTVLEVVTLPAKPKLNSLITQFVKAYDQYRSVTSLTPIEYPSNLFQGLALLQLVNGIKIVGESPSERDLNSNSWVQSIVEYVVGPGAVQEDLPGYDVFYWTRIPRSYFVK